MPAIKNPVIKRSEKRDVASVANHATAVFDSAPSKEQIKNNLTGEYLSANEKKAKTKVPAIKPNIMADVILLTAYCDKPSVCFSSGKIALPTNQSDVPAN